MRATRVARDALLQGALAALAAGGVGAQRLPEPEPVPTVFTLTVPPRRPELIRYNRAEGLSLGVRGAVRFDLLGEAASAALTVRLGSADREPRATLALERQTLAYALRLSAYHALRAMDPQSRAFQQGNTLSALYFGRDDGDYYEASGAALGWAPPSALRAWFGARVYGERQKAVARATEWSVAEALGWDAGFRPQPAAESADQVGVELTLSPRWGSDPTAPRAGAELRLLGERGDFDFERVRLSARAILGLPGSVRLEVDGGGGTTHGSAPAQRLWRLGGPATLRGFPPGAAVGPSFLRGRVELARTPRELSALAAVEVVLFSDVAWAGSRNRVVWNDALASAGMGLSLLDGVLRLDAAWSWQGPAARRLDLYLDAPL